MQITTNVSVSLKELAKLGFKVKQMQHRRKVMKDRVKMADAIKHRETCENCRGLFNALAQASAYSAAGVATQNLMTSLISKRVH